VIVNLLVVAAGGAVGAALRYGASVLIGPHPLPYATVLVNVTGSLAIGLVMALPLEPRVQLFVATGVLGGYTTFSTFSYETLRLVETGRWWWAAANVAVSVAAGLAAAALGARLGR
jgi:fluoride exporter